MKPDPTDITANFHKGADTSVQAFKETPQAVRNTGRAAVLKLIQETGSNGITCERIEIRLGISHQTASARISELRLRDKLIVDSGRRRATQSGHKARVYVASEVAKQEPNLF